MREAEDFRVPVRTKINFPSVLSPFILAWVHNMPNVHSVRGRALQITRVTHTNERPVIITDNTRTNSCHTPVDGSQNPLVRNRCQLFMGFYFLGPECAFNVIYHRKSYFCAGKMSEAQINSHLIGKEKPM